MESKLVTPYRLAGQGNGRKELAITNGTGQECGCIRGCCGLEEGVAMVRACNAHDAMLAICERLAELIESGDIPNVKDWSEYGRLLSAIAAAKGES